MTVHSTAAAGYARAGDDYERARPAYPSEMLDALAAQLDLGAGSVVVELGAGTGKLSRLLAPRVQLLVATEPVPAMLVHLRAATSHVVASAAEAIPVAARSVDAVVAATAFHWFRAEAALAEIRRVLRPGGGLGLMWNNPDRNAGWVAQVWGVVDEARGSVPGNLDMRWRAAFTSTDKFTPIEHARFSHAVALSREELLTRVSSISFVAALPDGERLVLLQRVRDIVETHPELRGLAAVPLPYRCDLYWCRSRPS